MEYRQACRNRLGSGNIARKLSTLIMWVCSAELVSKTIILGPVPKAVTIRNRCIGAVWNHRFPSSRHHWSYLRCYWFRRWHCLFRCYQYCANKGNPHLFRILKIIFSRKPRFKPPEALLGFYQSPVSWFSLQLLGPLIWSLKDGRTSKCIRDPYPSTRWDKDNLKNTDELFRELSGPLEQPFTSAGAQVPFL